jgi:2-hydroxychromene-2-carboxylate isomerase
MTRPVLYFDVGSPFAYLAAARAERVLGVDPLWQPVLVGGLFKLAGRSSWARGDAERRAATWAQSQGAAKAFALAATRRAFVEGRDLSLTDEVLAALAAAGLDADPGALADPGVKLALREATEAAHARGVFGVPTVAVGDELFWGDDRLEEAAVAHRTLS